MFKLMLSTRSKKASQFERPHYCQRCDSGKDGIYIYMQPTCTWHHLLWSLKLNAVSSALNVKEGMTVWFV
jgi:hypothetical protein